MPTANHEAFRRWGHATMTIVAEAVTEYNLLHGSRPNYSAAYSYVTSHLAHAPSEENFRDYVTRLREEGLPQQSKRQPAFGNQKILGLTRKSFGSRLGRSRSIMPQTPIKGIDLNKLNQPILSREKH